MEYKWDQSNDKSLGKIKNRTGLILFKNGLKTVQNGLSMFCFCRDFRTLIDNFER